MAKIVVIDDDYALEILVENLSYRGHDVRRLGSAAKALEDLRYILSVDLVIHDIIMSCPVSLEGHIYIWIFLLPRNMTYRSLSTKSFLFTTLMEQSDGILTTSAPICCMIK